MCVSFSTDATGSSADSSEAIRKGSERKLPEESSRSKAKSVCVSFSTDATGSSAGSSEAIRKGSEQKLPEESSRVQERVG